MDNHGHLASETPKYKHPKDHPPPRGVKISLFTSGGIQTVGYWDDSTNYVAWGELIKMDKDLLTRLIDEGKMVGYPKKMPEESNTQE